MSAPPDLLETLLLPFANGELAWPVQGRVLFMRARAGVGLHEIPAGLLVCEQSFKPWADALATMGHVPVAQSTATAATVEETEVAEVAEVAEVTGDADGGSASWPVVLLLPPRQREEARALLAQALQHLTPGGVVVAAQANNEGARSGEADLARLAGGVRCLSKNKCRVFWAQGDAARWDAALIDAWAGLDAVRSIADGRYLSRPGLFAWSHIDAASALLVRCLPGDLAGRGADLGAGFGYLASEVLVRCPKVVALDLYEAEARALELARTNLQRHARAHAREHVALEFFWCDVTRGLVAEKRYDFIVSNPPFHQGRADEPGIGRTFLVEAADALVPGGRFWLVANRHLPYEDILKRHFRKQRLVCEEQGFKVIEAVK